tara:strand:- start:105 stop:449 length:345 start_codon:yes stop_codon:yes gene_type:complete
MSLLDHFFKGKICECSFRCLLAWCFFLCSIGLSTTIILINPKRINYGEVPLTTKIIFVVTLSSIVGIISRCMCYEPKVYTELPNNGLQYHETRYSNNNDSETDYHIPVDFDSDI